MRHAHTWVVCVCVCVYVCVCVCVKAHSLLYQDLNLTPPTKPCKTHSSRLSCPFRRASLLMSFLAVFKGHHLGLSSAEFEICMDGVSHGWAGLSFPPSAVLDNTQVILLVHAFPSLKNS